MKTLELKRKNELGKYCGSKKIPRIKWQFWCEVRRWYFLGFRLGDLGPWRGWDKTSFPLLFSWVCVPSHFSHVQLFATLWIVDNQAPLSMGFSRQDYCCGLLCPPPGNLPDPGIEPVSLMSPALAGGFFTTGATWEALLVEWLWQITWAISASVFLSLKWEQE